MKTMSEQLIACAELGKVVTGTLDRERILEHILNRLSELVAARTGPLYLLPEDTRELGFELAAGLDLTELPETTLQIDQGIAGTVVRTGQPILVPDAENDPRIHRHIDDKTGFVTRSLITLPLKRGDSVIGVLQMINPEDESLFDEARLPVLELISDFVAIAMTNASNHERMTALTLADDVSGFFNARYLHQTLAELIESETETCLVFLDMDQFKHIVDTYGHPLGGKVLKEVAEVIDSRLDDDDSLIRYGGDEFVILLPRHDKKTALKKVERIRQAVVSTSFLVEDGHDVRATASFGIAHYPEDATDAKELLRSADTALFRSKDRGKNTITVA